MNDRFLENGRAMSDAFYRWVCRIARPPLAITSRPIELHVDRVPRTGAFLLAPNHTSPFDIPCLMRSTPRAIDFLSIVEMKRKRIIGPLYEAMNCVFVDRDRTDLAAARSLRQRLEQGRVVAMFPEGNIRGGQDLLSPSPGSPAEDWGEGDFEPGKSLDIRNHPHPDLLPAYREKGPEQATPNQSVTHGGSFKLGILKLAQQARVPIIPCVMINTAAHLRARNWLPFRRWSYGINFGEAIRVDDVPSARNALAAAYVQLFSELAVAYAGRSSH